MNKKMSLSALAILFLTLSSGSVFSKDEVIKVEDANNPDEFVQLVKTTNPQVLKKVVYKLLGQFTPEEMLAVKIFQFALLGGVSGAIIRPRLIVSSYQDDGVRTYHVDKELGLGARILSGALIGAAAGYVTEILPFIWLKLSQRFGTKNRAPKLRKLLEAAQNAKLFEKV